MNDTPSIYSYMVMGAFIIIYMLPGIVAVTRKSLHGGFIFLINIFAGWVLPPFGWIALLLWACLDSKFYRMKIVRSGR